MTNKIFLSAIRFWLPTFSIMLLAACQTGTMISEGISIGEEVMLPSGNTMLSASLLFPDSIDKAPAIVILTGSGQFSYRTYWEPNSFGIWKIIAESFVEKGFAVLLLEKRGINKSEGNWKKSNFETRASDALAAIEWLRSKDNILDSAIGLCGHSQGGWIAQLAAARSPGEVAFIITLNGPGVSVQQQVLDDYRSEWKCKGLSDEMIEKKLRKKLKKLKRFRGFSSLLKVNHLSRTISYDPAGILPLVECQVLAVFAEEDQLVYPKPNIAALRSGLGQNAEELLDVRVIPGANHFFIESEFCTPWSDLKPKFAPDFETLMANWDFLDKFSPD